MHINRNEAKSFINHYILVETLCMSDQIFSEYYILKTNKGENEISVEFSNEKNLFPKNGFFFVVDRLNLKEN
ncbi:MAG: hypothetical protein ACI83B_000224 [Sediminicola sp.]|jgi:hypothetical protein|tara:strand:+ start:1535 stop:1750 length:216 start_codon:yes stop_codon:yes gene_type:complete